MNITEQALIGGVILNPDKLVGLIDIVSHEDFTDPTAKRCFASAVSLWRSSKTVDAITIADGDMSLIPYLAESTSVGAGFAVHDYARTIAGEARNRRITEALKSIASSKEEDKVRLEKIVNLYKSEMRAGSKSADIVSVIDRFNKYTKENKLRGSMGSLTGFKSLDDKNIEYVAGHLWTVGGWTSSGKTATMIQKIVNLLRGKRSVMVISTEMTEAQIVARIISNVTRVPTYCILSERFRSEEEAEIVSSCINWLKECNLMIHDDVYEAGEIEVAVKKATLKTGVDVLFIDYVQNCRVTGMSKKYDVQAELAIRMQEMTKVHGITTVCLSQLSNSVGRGETDQLELKGAGEWAAVSDISVQLRRNKNDEYLLAYNVKKNRHGPVVDFVLEYKSDFVRLEEVI